MNIVILQYNIIQHKTMSNQIVANVIYICYIAKYKVLKVPKLFKAEIN